MKQLSLPISKPVIEAEIDGIEMGVLEDGTPYLTGRSLARFCGTAPSTIINQEHLWRAGKRDGKLAKMLVRNGVNKPSLVTPIRSATGATLENAYPDDICILFLSYYALHADEPKEQAKHNLQLLAQKTLRELIYEATGYKASNPWQQYHDRLMINNAPPRHFSVFQESASIVLKTIRSGLNVDAETMPDISVGIQWAKYWEKKNLKARCGERMRYEHNFPDYFPQSKGRGKTAWVYPNSALGIFRDWFEEIYIPQHLPMYLDRKVKDGKLNEGRRALILRAVEDDKTLE